MAEGEDLSVFHEVLEPFRRVLNKDATKDKPSSDSRPAGCKMAEDGDLSMVHNVYKPVRKVTNKDVPKDKPLPTPFKSIDDSSFNNSLTEDLDKLILLGKRKCGVDISDECMPEKRMCTTSKPPSKAEPTPLMRWETKMLKADLIVAKAQQTTLEALLNKQRATSKKMQILYEEEKQSLKKQQERDQTALREAQDSLALKKRRHEELMDDYNEAIKELKENKAKWDKQKGDLQKEVADLKDKLLDVTVNSKGQLSEMEKDMGELLQALEGSQSEVEMLKAELSKQTSKAEQFIPLKIQLEKQTFELQMVTNKLMKLENERDSYKDWQQLSKTAHNRLTNMAELEKEVVHLRATVRSLRDGICNKLLLEEQVHQLQSRVDALQPVQNELHEAKVKLASLESSLAEWKNAARTHGVENARALSHTLESAFNSQVNASAACSQTQTQLAQLTEEVATVKFERDKMTTKLNELLTVGKNQESLIHRLQKRLLLITRERDSYIQQLDSYEKELTVTLSGETGAGSAALLSERVQQLEKALQGYRDLLATHDQTTHIKLVESLRLESSKWREETENLKRDIAKLRTQRDTLHDHLERIGAQSQTTVPQLTDNQAAVAQKKIQADLEAAQDEIKTLKAELRNGGASSACTAEMQQLRQQLESSDMKLQSLKEEFTSSAQEYRDVCYMLMGYRIDRTGYKNYRISNMYAESSEEYLTFTLDDDGIAMVHTDYSATLGELVEIHLHQHRSIPLFLSSLTMDLYTRQHIQ